MAALVFNGSKLTFFLMWVFALPMLLEMEAVLTLWLKTPPPAAILFTQLAIVESLIMALSMPLATAARAPGKMALYETILGSIQIAIFFVSWWVLSLGYEAEAVFYVAILANVVMFKIRLLLVNYLTALPVMAYYKKVVMPVILVSILSAVPSILVANVFDNSLLTSLLVIVFSVIVSTVVMYYVGLDKYWRRKVITVLQNKLFKNKKLA